MILGILGIICCGLFAAIPAAILGSQARNEIAASGGMQTGDGMAQAGLILGVIGIVLSVLVVVVYGALIILGVASGSFSANDF